MYLVATPTTATTINADGGLATAGVRVTFNNPAGVAGVVSASDVKPATPANGGQFDFGTPSADATSAAVSNASFGGVTFPASDRVLLGTFTFAGQSVGTTTLGAVDPNPAQLGDISSFTSSAPFDQPGFLPPGAATLQVVPVPEPAFVLAAAGGLSAAAGAVRRRRASPGRVG